MRVGRKRATDVEDLRCDPLVKELLNLDQNYMSNLLRNFGMSETILYNI